MVLLDLANIKWHISICSKSISGCKRLPENMLVNFFALICETCFLVSIYACSKRNRLSYSIFSLLMEEPSKRFFFVINIIQRNLNAGPFRSVCLPLRFLNSLSFLFRIDACSQGFQINAVCQNTLCWSLKVYFSSLAGRLVV